MRYFQPIDQPSDPNASFNDGNLATGTQGSIVPAGAVEQPQREVVNFITDSGLIANGSDLHQLGEGVQTGKVLFGIDVGTSGVIVSSLVPAPLAYYQGMVVRVLMANNIPGPSTMNLNGLGAKQCLFAGAPLLAGILEAGDCGEWIYDGANFQLIGGARIAAYLPIFLTGPRILYVNASTGNDGYDGLTATVIGAGHGPFATIQRAIAETQKWNMNGYSVTIEVANGTYTGPIICGTINGVGTIFIIGNNTTPVDCQVVGPNIGGLVNSAFIFSGTGHYVVSGFRVSVQSGTSVDDNGYGIVSEATGMSLEIFDMQFGPCVGAHIVSTGGGFLLIGQGAINIEAEGNAPVHITAQANGTIEVSAVSSERPVLDVLGSVTFTDFASASDAYLNVVYNGITGAGNVSATKYAASANGVISTAGSGTSYLPGNVAGFVTSGGVYE